MVPVPWIVLAVSAAIRSLLLGGALISGSLRRHITGKCVSLDFGMRTLLLGCVFTSGSRMRPITGKCVSREFVDALSFNGRFVNLGL